MSPPPFKSLNFRSVEATLAGLFAIAAFGSSACRRSQFRKVVSVVFCVVMIVGASHFLLASS